MRSARWWIATGLLLIAPLLPAAAATRDAPAAAQAPDPELMGMVVRDPWFDWDTNPAFEDGPNQAFQDRMGATLASAGARWVRLDLRIAAPLTPTVALPPGFVEQEIEKNTYFIEHVAPRHGLKVLGLLSFDLIQGTDANLLDTGPFTVTSKYGGGVNLYMDEWLDRALMVADRYGDGVAAYQVLNEQNRLPQYLPGGPAGNAIEPQIVARLVTKFYRFCRGIAPLPPGEPAHGCQGAQIVLGGLHPRGTTDAQGRVVTTDAEYLQEIYADPAFQDFSEDPQTWPIDGIGYHPYPEEIRQSKDLLVDRGLARIRAALVEAGDPCRQLWVSEVGYNVGFDVDGPSNPIPQQSEFGQAAFMEDVYTSLGARRICGGQQEIAHIFWFKYEDFPPASGAFAQRWGVVRIPFTEGACPGGACYDVNGTPETYRAAYYTYRRLAGLPGAQVSMPLMFR
jgi:hypothetical protein